jgi:Transport and Golgi organisation 2
MCTAIVSVGPGPIVLLAGIRDEFTARSWLPPARHWPDHPGLIGGKDLVAGGTWLAVAPSPAGPSPTPPGASPAPSSPRRVACVLNGRGAMAPASTRRSRGVLPLQGAAEGKLDQDRLADFDPFYLLIAEPGSATLTGWDGENLTERHLAAGLHMIVNSGLGSDLLAAPGPGDPQTGQDRELARLRHFLPRLHAAARPLPKAGVPVEQAWGGWLPLLNGDGIAPDDPRALIVRHDFGDGRVWGTTSISLIALSPDGMRYDFTSSPGDPAAWQPVPVAEPARPS